MDNRIVELVANAMTPYKLNLQAGDRLLIVTDTGMDPLIVQAFMTAGVTLGLDVALTMSTPLPYHHADLGAMTVAAMGEADLVHLLTSTGSLHGAACHAQQLAGKRFVASEEITVDMLRSGAATADYERMNVLAEGLYRKWTDGRAMHVTSAEGTDLRAQITGRPSWITAGRVLENPGLDLYACGFPDGEVGVAPIEDTIEGTIVWDTSMHHVGLISEPIVATVERGRVVDLSGGVEAQRLRSYLERNGDDGSWMVAETSIGINDRARVTGIVREDKKLAGSMHIALGMNTDTGGTVASRTHVDGVLRRPTLRIDGELVLEAGQIVGADD